MGKVIHGDALEVLEEFEDNYFSSVPTDGPYGLGFMNKDWDKFTSKEYQEFSFQWGTKVFRVIKPGSYVASFSAPRMYHRMVCGLEDAGFVIKDMINWVYGSGFPKSLDISKAIDKYYGLKRKRGKEIIYPDGRKASDRNIIGNKHHTDNVFGQSIVNEELLYESVPNSNEAKKWYGWGTSLKPAHEPIVLAQKPYENIYAENVLKYGVGGLNIGASRIQFTPIKENDSRIYNQEKNITRGHHENATLKYAPDGNEFPMYKTNKGRWPSNFILTHHPECKMVGTKKTGQGKQKHNSEIKRKGFSGNGPYNDLSCGFDVNKCQDLGNYGEEIKEQWECHPECPIRMLDEQSGDCPTGDIHPYTQKGKGNVDYAIVGDIRTTNHKGDTGGASRFFYCAKAFKTERNAGLADIRETPNTEMVNRKENSAGIKNARAGAGRGMGARNNIATLKPINLMRYLVRLITPPNGIVLDLFAGSGTTGIACIIEGFDYVLIEKRKRFAKVIIPKRLEYWKNPKHWENLKDHPLLPNIEKQIKQTQNYSIERYL